MVFLESPQPIFSLLMHNLLVFKKADPEKSRRACGRVAFIGSAGPYRRRPAFFEGYCPDQGDLSYIVKTTTRRPLP